MRIPFVILILFSIIDVHAQVDTTIQNESVNETVVRKQLIPGIHSIGIQIMPFSVRTQAPRLRLGAIARMDRWSGLLDIEYGNEWIRDLGRSDSDLHYRFYGLRPEVRYAWNQDIFRELEHFFAVELPFNYYEREIMWGDFSENGTHYTFERGIQKRLRHSVIFKIGIISDIGRNFFMEAYFGMGPAWRTIRYDDLVNLTSVGENSTEEWGFNLDSLDPGRRSVTDLAMGMRVGYWIGRKEEKLERGSVEKWRRASEE